MDADSGVALPDAYGGAIRLNKNGCICSPSCFLWLSRL
jgi:hypothetical protein